MTVFDVSVYKKDGSLWKSFTKDDYYDVLRLTDDWKMQPGTGRIVVVGKLEGRVAQVVEDWRVN